MIKLLMFSMLVCLGESVAGDRSQFGAGGNIMQPLKPNLEKPDVNALGPVNKYLAKLGGHAYTLGPLNTFLEKLGGHAYTSLEKLGPRALRQKAKAHCELSTKTSYLAKFTKFLFGWWNWLVEQVAETVEDDCEDCSIIRKAQVKVVETEEDAMIQFSCGRTITAVYQCALCYKVKQWNFLICVAAGFIIHNTTLFVAVTVEDKALFKWSYKIKLKFLKQMVKALSCVPFPPPLAFLSGCLTPTFDTPSVENNYTWQFCANLEIGLFQIPVLTLYSKCFNFGGTPKMIIQGPNPAIGDKEPAKAVVQDENSYNSLVCLSNSEKKKALERRDGTAKPEPTIEMTARTNWNESEPNDIPPYLTVLFIKGAVDVKEILETDGARLQAEFPKINEMLNRTTSEKWLNSSDSRAWEQQALSCGGVLLTKDKVLTVCACVRSFYVVHKLDRSPKQDIFPYDLMSLEIFMEIPGIYRTGDETYQLDTDPDKFMMESLCARRLEAEDSWGVSSLMMAMAFRPEIADPKPGQFVHWPPRMVQKGEDVVLVAFGLEEKNQMWVFRNSSKDEINFHKRAVNFYFKECHVTKFAEQELLRNKSSGDPGTFDALSRISGFCAKVDQSELCDGKVGYPLVAGGELRALAALPIDCEGENSIAGAIFNYDAVEEVDSYLHYSANESAPRHSMLLASVVVAVFHQVFRGRIPSPLFNGLQQFS